MRITQHFSLEELTASATAKRLGISNTPTAQIQMNLAFGVLAVLEPARVELGESITITSGYRNAQLNKAVGGVSNSQHLTGCAADLRVKNRAYAERLFAILKQNKWVDQLLFERSNTAQWIHVSWSTCPRHAFNFNYKA